MKIELLNVRIQIQKNSVVVDKYGNHKNEWAPYYSCSGMHHCIIIPVVPLIVMGTIIGTHQKK